MKTFNNREEKQVGYIKLNKVSDIVLDDKHWLKDYYKIIFIEGCGQLTIDFVEYRFHRDTLFFFSIDQHLIINDAVSGKILFFNADFYCVAFHDKELACDGLLFDNVFEFPFVNLLQDQRRKFQDLFISIKDEIDKKDFWRDEMIKSYIKQIIIHATRNLVFDKRVSSGTIPYDLDFTRKFSQLVERYYREYHNVSDYAKMLNVTPKTLNRKIVREKQATPNNIIKQRIILQAKRLLTNTSISIKEIADYLGYKDYSYFIRFFKIQTGTSPLIFRESIDISTT